MPHLSDVGISGLQAGEDIKWLLDRIGNPVFCLCLRRSDTFESSEGDGPLEIRISILGVDGCEPRTDVSRPVASRNGETTQA